MSLSAIPSSLRKLVFERDAGGFRYCRLQQIGQAAIFHIDHIIPRSVDGKTEAANLALQCPNCSLHKSNKLTGIDPLTGEMATLSHPLKDRWNDHFILAIDGICTGTSSTGRATATALRMNDDRQELPARCKLSLGLSISKD